MCGRLGIKKTRTTAYHPAGNGQGQGEIWNRTRKGLLKAKVDSDVERWDEHIGACLMAYRSSVHQSTGYTSFSLMYGHEMKLPLDIMVGLPDEEEYDFYGDFACKLKRNLTDAFRHVRENLQAAQCRQKEYYDRGVKNCSYQPGDLVFLYNPALKPGEASKFRRYWKGPYVVLERVTEVNYKIRELDGSRATVQVVHFNNLKLFRHKETAADPKTSSNDKIMNGDDGGENEGDFDDPGEDVVFPQPNSVNFEPTNEPEPESRELEAELSCGNEQEREICVS